MITIIEPAPSEVIDSLADSLRGYGASVEKITPMRGIFTHISGRGEYRHDGENLTILITSHAGHFAENMLKGGIRQLIQEAVEDLAFKGVKPAC